MAWSSPPDAINGAIIQASLWNTGGRDNLRYLKGQAGTIAFEAGATFAGGVGVTGQIDLAGNLVFGGSGRKVMWPTEVGVKEDYTSTGAVLRGVAAGLLYDQSDGAWEFRVAGAQQARIDSSPARMTIGANTVWHAGNDGAASGLDADTVDGFEAAALAKLASANFTVLQLGGQTVATLNSANFTALQQGGSNVLTVASPGYVSGTYSGNGGSTARQFTTGFVPRMVIIAGGTTTGNVEVAWLYSASGGAADNNGGNVYPITQSHLHASDGFVVADGNAAFNGSGVNYFYVAFR